MKGEFALLLCWSAAGGWRGAVCAGGHVCAEHGQHGRSLLWHLLSGQFRQRRPRTPQKVNVHTHTHWTYSCCTETADLFQSRWCLQLFYANVGGPGWLVPKPAEENSVCCCLWGLSERASTAQSSISRSQLITDDLFLIVFSNKTIDVSFFPVCVFLLFLGV